jgi:hypothetical protein
MCGIFGWDLLGSRLSPEQRNIIAMFLTAQNDQRGGNSWGVFNLDTETIYRGLGDITSNWQHIAAVKRIMCHTRLATTGGVTVDNAHPFCIKGIVGAHNGIVHNHEFLNRKYGRSCSVDSEHIFMHLATGKGLDDLVGYGAIEWVDTTHTDIVKLCKISNWADLAIAQVEDAGCVWSSSGAHLAAALLAAEVPYEEYKIKTGSVIDIFKGEASDNGNVLLMSTDEYSTYSDRGYSLGRYVGSAAENVDDCGREASHSSRSHTDEVTEYSSSTPCGSMSCGNCFFLDECAYEQYDS